MAQGVATALLAGPSSTARGASTALAIGGVLYGVGQLSEPITWRVLRHPRATPASWRASVAANVMLPTALTILSVQTRR